MVKTQTDRLHGRNEIISSVYEFFHEYTGWCNIGQIKGKIQKFFVFTFCNLCGLGSNRQC